ncbi:hypothetical protein [Amycolatopsis australiensis]|uniref:Uncharacterized protein n=1 Tax=Amycolatopsis australiensis TaxID=546364 RepID=A0A1K1RTB3_9PSEU|nr:hypothetical protein SAMN04489730_3889 [Amycolatopsis australiensis]
MRTTPSSDPSWAYPPASAVLTRWYGCRRGRALTTLTLVAGFAGTVFAPLTEHLSWWTSYLVLVAWFAPVRPPGGWGSRRW